MTVELIRGDQRITLNARQRRQFMRELEAVTRRRASKGLPRKLDMGPDCLISVRIAKKAERRFRLYGRIVLLEERTGKVWQFYFGLLIAEWFHLTFPQPKAPFNPVIF